MSEAPSTELLLESLLYVAPEPLDVHRIAQTLGVGRDEIESALERLTERCRDRGVRVQRHGEAVQLVSAPESAAVIERFLGVQTRTKLSAAALETLAIVAYHQPASRSKIEGFRGVSCERALTTLTARGLITEIGRADTVGRPILFGTTAEFLEYFGLSCLDELPPMGDNQEAALHPKVEPFGSVFHRNGKAATNDGNQFTSVQASGPQKGS